MLAATMRALPAGLILLAFVRRLPKGSWWWKTAVLGTLNFGAFFPLLFFAAYRLPGGVASTLGSVQPLLVAGFSILILRRRPHSAGAGRRGGRHRRRGADDVDGEGAPGHARRGWRCSSPRR